MLEHDLESELTPAIGGYADLTRTQLVTLLPELLLCGQFVDRAGMPWAIIHLGQDEMAQVACEEWMGASPIYTQRMQRALDFVGDDVITIFKGLQLDCGAPPQYMDFRYSLESPTRGHFELAHCGALMDVEPMGQDMAKLMCHDMEDPTFDATAIATNPKARMRPIHRPPRRPEDIAADTRPHCRWVVFIDETADPLPVPSETVEMQSTRAAGLELSPIDPSDDGRSAYDGPLVDDIDFAEYSRSALVRMADEVTLQLHLLDQAFARAIRRRVTDDATAIEILTNQAMGFAASAAARFVKALEIPPTLAGAAYLLSVHPVLNPRAYVALDVDGSSMHMNPSPAQEDPDSWPTLTGPGRPEVLQAIVRALEPSFDVEVTGTDSDWTARVVHGVAPRKEPSAIKFAGASAANSWEFSHRTSLPITPV
ncbi:hypothetical protein [Gordonia rhizosphera]|uniref:Uncharacterized protein n=1 Tax=Gordonia rhizosphera NBRC 16068 TaxID=1108045 RepID=K6WXZ6_9ACTN|nr:hypothetical protein [Gordonia rhizosphera]GAB91424.1 hypothetical protein GORHZ_131_00110 [Gordonia rhizosphera NBRC 16068]